MRFQCVAAAPNGNDIDVILNSQFEGTNAGRENETWANKTAGAPLAVLNFKITNNDAKGMIQKDKFYTIEIKPVQT
jgi:hypothetical protein